jgi:hypothetical protein
MPRRFISIGSLGSLAYQRRWCVNGTVETGWVDLYELVETTIHAAKHKATHPVLSTDLSVAQREALIRFHDRVDTLYGLIPWRDPSVSIADIVERNPAMQQIRDAANECLRELGVSFTEEELMED